MELQSLAFRWLKFFENSHVKANPGKSHIFLSNEKTEKVPTNYVVLASSVQEELLNITLDCELKFGKHITGICKKVSQKMHVLCGITSFMLLNKQKLLMKMLVQSSLIIAL